MPKKKVDKKTVRVHTCFSPEDEMPSLCACRRLIFRHQADRWVRTGMAVWIAIGRRVFRDKVCMLEGSSQCTPRGATIERPHIEKAYTKPFILNFINKILGVKQSYNKEEKEIILRSDAEERNRIEEYGQLTERTWRALVREIPAEEFDKQKEADRGFPVLYVTERTK